MIYDLAELAGTKEYKVKNFRCGPCDKKDVPLDQCTHQVYRDTINLPAEAIRVVIFGTDCSPKIVRSTLEILSDSSYAGVERYWSSLASSKYAVQYVKEKAGKDYVAFIQQQRAEEFADAKHHLSHDGKKMTRHIGGKGINFVLKTAPKTELGGYTVPLIGKVKKTPTKRKM